MSDNKTTKKNYDKLVKVLQIGTGILMALMVIAVVILIIKFDIKPSNAAEISKYFTGGTFTIAAILIGVSVIKSFALVVTPALLFAISGIIFEDLWTAIIVNIIATLLSSFLPYFLGRFTGKSMVDTLKKRFPKIQKLDDFAESNEAVVAFVVKASGLLPCDLSSLLFGAMDMNFTKYIIFSNLGMLPLIVMWTLLGNKGDLSNPLSFLYVLPILIFAIVASILMKKFSAKKHNAKTDSNN